jgi:hypothetical protein
MGCSYGWAYAGTMKKRIKMIGGLALLALIALQLTNPPHQNPSVAPGHDLLATNVPSPSVAAILKAACYDCHSCETKWPWYSYVAPVSWYVVRDVNAARASMNFSEWPHDDPQRARKRWGHIADEVESGEMPLANYTRWHSQARLDERQRAELVKWASQQAGRGARRDRHI